MKYLAVLSTLICLALSSCSHLNYVVIQHVDVFDGETMHEDMSFVFDENQIIAISPKMKTYKGATEIDGTNMTIIPPLMNAHVHVRNHENLQSAMEVGIFGMLDMFSTDRRANHLREVNDSLLYAKCYSSNVGATVPGGHGTQFKVTIPTIGDTLSPTQFVQDRMAAKADYIKITQEHTMGKLSATQLAEIATETHKHKKVAVAHISELEDGMEVLEQGVDGLAHIWYRKNSIASAEQLQAIQSKKAFVIPTLSVIQKVIAQANEGDYAENYLTFEEVGEEVRKLHESGVQILAGTDAPNYGMNYSTQYFEELKLLSESGLSNVDVLKAGTTNIYNRFRLSDFGVLQKNSSASFILIEGKPHVAIEDISNKKRIWKWGVEISNS